MKITGSIWIAGALAAAVGLGCGGGNKEAQEPVSEGASGGGAAGVSTPVQKAALDRFNAALDDFNAHDKANDWSDANCSASASAFEGAASAQSKGKFPEATYDAGLAYQRCGNDKEARAHFQKALADEPKFHFARAQLALYQFKADNNADAAISALEQAVTDANFQNVPALVDLAMFQMLRDSDAVGANCQSKAGDLKDFECAKLNLQRALAIDDGYMPAFNQLALYYFGSAKKKSGGKKFGRTIATNSALASPSAVSVNLKRSPRRFAILPVTKPPLSPVRSSPLTADGPPPEEGAQRRCRG